VKSTGTMPSPSDALKPAARVSARLLGYPIIRIVLALVSIAIPFAVVAIPFNLFVSDKTLKKVGALLLAAVILVAYQTYVKVIEKRVATELSSTRATRELGSGLLVGALLLSFTIGALAALGVYRVTGIHGWAPMLATVPAFIMGAVLEEVVMRGVVFRILEQWLGSWIALAISAALFGILLAQSWSHAAERRRRYAGGGHPAGGCLHADPAPMALYRDSLRLEFHARGNLFCRRFWRNSQRPARGEACRSSVADRWRLRRGGFGGCGSGVPRCRASVVARRPAQGSCDSQI
jgi:membrane protease YdiL (CAAX protease family)